MCHSSTWLDRCILCAGCERLGLVFTTETKIFLSDGSRLHDDEEVTDPAIVNEKLLFLGEHPPKDGTAGNVRASTCCMHIY